jgi:cytochrome P450
MDEIESQMSGKVASVEVKAKFDKAIDIFMSIVMRNLEKLPDRKVTEDTGGTFIDYLRHETDQDIITSEFMTFLVAGFETTSSTMFWCADALARNPDI